MPTIPLPSSVKFHYIKGNFFRVIHVDGAVGGLTPGREIFVSLFSERAALPQMIEMSVSPDGNLGDEIHREGKEGLVREMEIGIVLNAKAANDLAKFLIEHVKLYKESLPESRQETIPTEKRQ